jgi:methylenetetrahydrofolate reductase (NADPH)
MKVIDHLTQANRPLISFEIIPPLRGGDAQGLLQLIEDVAPYGPPFIDVTSHAAEVNYEETPDGIRRKVKRKRPGTLGICALIQNKYNIDAVPHILCHGFTREETEDFLIELKYLGIDNVLAIRGDKSGPAKPKPAPERTVNPYAIDLVTQIADMNRGRYLEDDLLDAETSDFGIGVAGYPEKHFEAPNLDSDIRWTKRKVDAGAEYIVTQMFFDNGHYFRYADACRREGITVPIVPGLKILTHKHHLSSIPRDFKVEIPTALADDVLAANPDHASQVGVEWTARQARELLDKGVPSLHFYVMQSSTAVTQVMGQLDL